MKKLMSILFFSFLSFYLAAQKCKETVDPITNEKKIEFIDKQTWHSTAYEMNSQKILFTKPFYFDGAMNTKASSGLEVIFKFENGEILALKTIGETAPQLMPFGAMVYSVYNFVFELTKNDIAKLAASPVVLIRCPRITDSGYTDLEKKDPHIKKTKSVIMNGAICIASSLK